MGLGGTRLSLSPTYSVRCSIHHQPHHFPNPADIYFSSNLFSGGRLYNGLSSAGLFILEADVKDHVDFALGLLAATALVFAFIMGGIHERRNIQDYGGFTQEWSSIKWKCEAVK